MKRKTVHILNSSLKAFLNTEWKCKKNHKILSLIAILLIFILYVPSKAVTFDISYGDEFPSEVRNACFAAAVEWGYILEDDINVSLHFVKSIPGISTGCLPFYVTGGIPYDTIRSLLIADSEAHESEFIMTLPTYSQYNAYYPAEWSINNVANLTLTKANAKALGYTFLPSNDAIIFIESSLISDFDYDSFVGAMKHEIGHALGFMSVVDYVDNPSFIMYQYLTTPTLLDLFRLKKGDVTTYGFTSAPRLLRPDISGHIFFTGTHEIGMSEGRNLGDGYQASHWKYPDVESLMRPISSGSMQITGNDIIALSLIGWDIRGWDSEANFTWCGSGVEGTHTRWLDPSGWLPRAIPCKGFNVYINMSSIGSVIIDQSGVICSDLHIDGSSFNPNSKLEILATEEGGAIETGSIQAQNEFLGEYNYGSIRHLEGFNYIADQLILGRYAEGEGHYNMMPNIAQMGGLYAKGVIVGEMGTGIFEQTARFNNIEDNLIIGNSTGSLGTYLLGGDENCRLTVAGTSFVGKAGNATFIQTGGRHNTGFLFVNSISKYELSSGTLEVTNGANISGTFDFANGNGSATMSGVIDLKNASIINAGSASFTVSPGGLLILPDGFDPYTQFGTFINYGTIIEPPTASIQSINAVPGPMPAVQGRDTLTFIGSGEDGDELGELPQIRTYRWISDLGKTDENSELYIGSSTSFSLSATDLKAGIHNISLTVQDNEGDWSEPVTDVLTVSQPEPVQGYDIEVKLYVNEAGYFYKPGESVNGDIWATNNGNYSQSGNLEVYLETSSGEPLDYQSYVFNNLEPGGSTIYNSFSLDSNYEGEAYVRAKAIVQFDENWANNEKRIPIIFSSAQNPEKCFDGFQRIALADGEEQIIRDHIFSYNNAKFYVDGLDYPLDGEYVPLDFIVFKFDLIIYGKAEFLLWWQDDIYAFSPRNLTIPEGGSSSFEVSKKSGSWPTLPVQDIEFIKGLYSGGWDPSVAPQDGKLVVYVQAPHGSRGTILKGWAHMYRTTGGPTNYTDAFQYMEFQAVSSPPETAIISGPSGTISTDSITFTWSGSDDTTPTAELQYAYKLEPLETDYSPFSTDTEKTYSNLDDGEYTFFVKARDLGGLEDPEFDSRTFIINTNRIPDMPMNQFPLSGQSNLSLTPMLVGSEFSDPDANDIFAQSTFQIRSNDGTYDSAQWDSGELAPGIINVQVNSELDYDKIYWWRCRYQDNKDAWSPWSNETSFTTRQNWTLFDFNEDGYINLHDFGNLAKEWKITPPWSQHTKSSIVDPNDYVRVQTCIHFPYVIVGIRISYEIPGHILVSLPSQVSVFHYDGLNWIFQSMLEPTDIYAKNSVGSSVAIDNNFAVTGSSLGNAAYVFKRNNTAWEEIAKLEPWDDLDYKSFGISTAISDDYIMVGAYQDNDNGSYSGSVYVYKLNNDIWTQHTKLTASDANSMDYFGYSVSMNGDYAIIGAFGDDENGIDSGATYIFKRNGDIWTQEAKLMAVDDYTTEDSVGHSVGIYGEYAILGTTTKDGGTGAAYIFKRNDTEWTQQAKLAPSDGNMNDRFGVVSITDGYAIIGSYMNDENNTDSGAAYIFSRDGEVWTQQTKLIASDANSMDHFGYSVSMDKGWAVIGTMCYTDFKGENSGASYIFKQAKPRADFTGDHEVNMNDLFLFVEAWLKR